MVQLTHRGFWSAGTLSAFAQITGLQAMTVDQRLFLVSTSGAYGELAAWEWTGTGLVLRDTQALSGTASLPAPGGLAVHESAGMGAFYSFGGAGQGLEAYRVTATGQIAALGPQGAGAITLESVLEVETAHGTQVFGGAREVNGL